MVFWWISWLGLGENANFWNSYACKVPFLIPLKWLKTPFLATQRKPEFTFAQSVTFFPYIPSTQSVWTALFLCRGFSNTESKKHGAQELRIHCHSWLSGNKDYQAFRFSIVRIVISVSIVKSLQNCRCNCLFGSGHAFSSLWSNVSKVKSP